jgi:hypothetical protein
MVPIPTVMYRGRQITRIPLLTHRDHINIICRDCCATIFTQILKSSGLMFHGMEVPWNKYSILCLDFFYLDDCPSYYKKYLYFTDEHQAIFEIVFLLQIFKYTPYKSLNFISKTQSPHLRTPRTRFISDPCANLCIKCWGWTRTNSRSAPPEMWPLRARRL